MLGGSVNDDSTPDLFRQAFNLLNDPHTNIQHKFDDQELIYLFESLKGNVKILPAITFLMSDKDEERGEQNTSLLFFNLVIEICGVF